MKHDFAMTMPLRERPRIRVRLEEEFTTPDAIAKLHEGRFTVHRETHAIGDPVDWLTNPSDDIEWHIVLHKFLHAPVLVQAWLDSADERHLDLLERHIESWTAQVPSGFIAADVTGRRIRNWVYALSLLDDGRPSLAATMEASLRGQVEWLRGNLHAVRNHRTLELFAIYIAGAFLDEAEWTGYAMAELLDNARSDFLADGVHVELSSHYHCIALRNFIEAIEIADDNDLPVPDELRRIVGKASHFGRVLHKPDGVIPALSDADTGDYREMLGQGRLPDLVETFGEAGYAIVRDRAAVSGDRDGGYLVLDCGPVGAGNHGHLDCLSFEFAHGGRSLIVDPGRHTYHEGGETNWRATFRQTRAHSLVQVDGLEQTAYRQAPKRMKLAGPAPRASLLAVRHLPQLRMVQASAASHEYDAVHQRTVVSHDAGWWAIHDRLESPTGHLYEALFQLSPEAQDTCDFVRSASGTRALKSPGLTLVPLAGETLSIGLEQGWIAPRYGERHPAPRLVCAQRGRSTWFCTLLLPEGSIGHLPDFTADADGLNVDGVEVAIPCLIEPANTEHGPC